MIFKGGVFRTSHELIAKNPAIFASQDNWLLSGIPHLCCASIVLPLKKASETSCKTRMAARPGTFSKIPLKGRSYLVKERMNRMNMIIVNDAKSAINHT